MIRFITDRVQNLYRKYVEQWYKDHNEGTPACFNEWFDNEYSCGFMTEHNRTGKNKRPAEFYTKEFVKGNTSLARRDLEEMPCPMDTYDFTDDDMQYIVDSVHDCMLRMFGRHYDPINDEEVCSAWWSEVEDVARSMGMNYYEDYVEDINDAWG